MNSKLLLIPTKMMHLVIHVEAAPPLSAWWTKHPSHQHGWLKASGRRRHLLATSPYASPSRPRPPPPCSPPCSPPTPPRPSSTMAAVGDDKETVGSTAPMLWDKKTQVGGRRAERSRRNGVNAHQSLTTCAPPPGGSLLARRAEPRRHPPRQCERGQAVQETLHPPRAERRLRGGWAECVRRV